MFCKKCGKVIDGDSTFCKFCGAALSEGSPAQPVQPMYQQPQPGQPMYQQPQPGQPMYQQPLPGQPMYQQPQPGQPMYQQPVYRPIYPTGGFYNASSFDTRLLWFIGVGISALFAALGSVLKLWKISFFYEEGEMSLLDFWISVAKISKYFGYSDTDGAVALIIIFALTISICFIIPIFKLVSLISGLTKKIPPRYLAEMGKNASVAALVGEGVMFIGQIIINSKLEYNVIQTTFFYWFILVISLVNLVLFAPNARMAKISASSSSSSSVAERSSSSGPKSIVEKRCNVCRTVFIIGTSCPKCGSKSFDVEK